MSINLETILRDLAVFRDPATLFESRKTGLGVEVSFYRAGDLLQYHIDSRTGSVRSLSSATDRFVNVASLLASAKFANIAGLKATQRRLLTNDVDHSMEPQGTIIVEINKQESNLTFNSVASLLKKSSDGFCILIDGPAGVGKTSLIRRLSKTTAQSPEDIPILHVTSKGRRLTNLRDAFAGTIADLRANFFPDELPILVRYGVLHVALDGFDEFVDPSGYKDAWAALKDFVRECNGGGPLILSGRDTFFDQQHFKTQLGSVSGGLDIIIARLSNVSIDVAKGWLTKKGWPHHEIQSEETERFFQPGSYTLRPFFIDQLAKLGGWQFVRDRGSSPKSVLIDAMVEREAHILATPLELAVPVIVKALYRLFETIAIDMVERESDTTPVTYLDFVAEYAFSGILEGPGIARLQHSLGSLALLESGSSSAEIRFPHSEIQNRFYAQALIGGVIDSDPMSLLGRVIMSMDRIEALQEQIVALDTDAASKFNKRLRNLREHKVGGYLYKQNVESIALLNLCREDINVDDGYFDDISAGDVKLSGKLRSARVSNADIARLDVRECSLTAVDFLHCRVGVLIAGPSTEFGEMAPDIEIIQLSEGAAESTIRVPKDVKSWVENRKIKQLTADITQLPLVKHFERVIRRFEAQTFIRDVDRDEGSFLLRGDKGEKIKEILSGEGFLITAHRDTAGRKAPIYSLANPGDLLLKNYPAAGPVGRLHDRLILEAKKSG